MVNDNHIQVLVPQETAPYWYQVDAPVIQDRSISDKAKIVYAIISGLTRNTGECWASNEYIGELIGYKKDAISSAISELEKFGHIKRRADGYYRRIITLSYVRHRPTSLGDRRKRLGGTASQPRGVGQVAVGDRPASLDNNINELDKLIIKDNINNNTTPQAEFIASWCSLYEQMTKERYKVDKKDYIIVAKLINSYGFESCIKKAKILGQLCDASSVWFTKGGWGDFTITRLSSMWNGIIEKKNAGERWLEKEKEEAHAKG